ncbi:cupin-like domain-containing protein [Aeoliella sp.]|uniref:cupin-like domain-containing protein n=1 Tax=Aeoliella sp. TaxID=2795800 RepID=UPI003CCC3B33
MMIPRIAATDRERFLEEFYHAEQPVVLTGAVQTPATAEEVCEKLNTRIVEDETASQRLLWYDVRRDLLDTICSTPAIVDEMMNPDEAFLRENCVRIWFNPGGHITPWHYDGHSLHVFNLQLKGLKRWTIVAPETPFSCTPFSHTVIKKQPSLDGKRVYEFDLDEGDMLFLPRYWYHYVESHGQMNINVNWVLMPIVHAVPTPTATREAEMMWLKSRLDPMLPAGAKQTLHTYAGVGKPAVDKLTENVTTAAGLARFGKELARVPLWSIALPAHIMKLQALLRTKRLLRNLRGKPISEAAAPEHARVANY